MDGCCAYRPKGAPPGRGRLARKTSDSHLHAPCDVLLASPTANNLHAFEAVQPAVLLDILAPPYEDEVGRTCTYYQYVRAGAGGRGQGG